MDRHDMKPCTGLHSPDPTTPVMGASTEKPGTPMSISSVTLDRSNYHPTFHIPRNLTQATVDRDPQLKRLQQDLLILTSFNENDALHWRPSWFHQTPFNQRFWTLHNPPNVVTERLPSLPYARQVFTRRMRCATDPPSFYVRDWEHWSRICDMYGVPHDFLCKEQIELMRLGLPRTKNGELCPPPMYPLYPEPQPRNQGRYILNPSSYSTHLPRKFRSVQSTGFTDSDGTEYPAEAVVVHSNGALIVEARENFFYYSHPSQWTHFDGYGRYREDEPYVCDESAPKDQGKGRRWSYLPWTTEQEKSCRPVMLKLGVRNETVRNEKEEAPSQCLKTRQLGSTASGMGGVARSDSVG